MFMSIAFGVLGIGLIIFGIKILLTGTLSKSEEAKIASYSKKGARTYKLINVVMYIVVGLFLIGECIVDILNYQKVIDDNMWIKLIMFGFIILMVVIYFIVASKCKKMTDNE
ncbi:MAG: hypothetical protein UH734_06175 [Ruminococcus sp.]|nr:hypothetical protein [Ruminococcus sp.]